jgi:two-component system sensor kinase FixL
MLMPEPYASKHDGFLDHYHRTRERRIIGIGREVAAKRKDGTEFPIELAVGEVEFDQRTRFTGFIRDITRLKEAELALRDSLEREHELQSEFHHISRLSAMGEMAATLAHELNQPLTAVINYVQATRRLLQSGAPAAQAKVPELVGKAVDQAHRAGEIISHLRSFVTRGESSRVSVDVNAVVREACDLALVGAKSQGVDVTLALADDLPLVSMDRVQIQQVIVNLVRNSIDALQDCETRAIEIRSSRIDPANVAIAVADTGPGLDPEIAAKLFQPFNTSKKTGMGIGLSVCRSIVQEHGGTIDAAPNPGGGVVFSVVLPVEA